MGVKYTQFTEGERNQIYALRKGEKTQYRSTWLPPQTSAAVFR